MKNPPASAGCVPSPPGSGRSLERDLAAHGSILGQENPVDRGGWRAAVHGVAASDAAERLQDGAPSNGATVSPPPLVGAGVVSTFRPL